MKNQPYDYYAPIPFRDLRALVRHHAQELDAQTAFSYLEQKELKTISYASFQRQIAQLGTTLLSRFPEHTKIAVIGENSYPWVLTYFATVCANCVIVPLDRDLAPEQIAQQLRECPVDALIYAHGYRDIADHLQAEALPIRFYCDMQDLPTLIQEGEALLQQGDTHFASIHPDPFLLSAIIYTSGTTGNAKGVMLTQNSILADVSAAMQCVKLSGATLAVLPLHHTFAFTTSVLATFAYGYPVHINSSLKRIMEDFAASKPQNIFVVPLFVETFYKRIWDSAAKSGKDQLLKKMLKISSGLRKIGIDLRRKLFASVIEAFGGNLDVIVSGGAPLDPHYVEEFDALGFNLLNGYGITECSPVVTVNRNAYKQPGSVGYVLPCNEIRIDDPDESGIGEVCIKGENVMLGYFGNESATAACLKDGWFFTGDLGRLDSNFLYITGRGKNLIILSNGKNVSPEELEIKLSGCIPLIQEVVVYAQNDEIVAEIFPDADIAAAQGITDIHAALGTQIEVINKDLPFYKNIGKIVLRDCEFPKTTTKKIKRT